MLAVMLLCGCSKQELPENKANEIPITFNVSTLNVDTQPMSRTASSGTVLGDVVNSISYYIFDSRSKLVSYGVSAFKPGVDPIPDGFGTIRVKLMPGEYKVIIYALGKGRGYFNINGINDGLNAESHFLMADKEVFYFTDNMTVGTSTTDFNINLPRISSLLRINITDDLTPDVKKVVIGFHAYEKWSFMTPGIWELTNSSPRTYNATLGETKMEEFDYYVVRPQEMLVSIKILGVNELLLGEKKITVSLYENRRTIISGELFNTIGNKDFTITVNDLWGEDNNVEI